MHPCKSLIKIACILVIAFSVQYYNLEAFAQDKPQMLWLLMEGNRYAYEALDKEGKLEKYREIEVGNVSQRDAQLEVLIKLYEYDESGTVSDSAQTLLQCNEGGSAMLMNVLVLLGTEGGEVKANISGDELRYPGDQYTQQTLEDITLKAKLKSGTFASLLGTRVTAVLNERRIYATKADSDYNGQGFAIEEMIVVKFFALGIKFKERSYRNYTIIHTKHGLFEQRLTFSDNSFLSLKLLPDYF